MKMSISADPGYKSHNDHISETIINSLNDNPNVTSVETDGDEIIVTWDDGGQSTIDVDSQDYIGY